MTCAGLSPQEIDRFRDISVHNWHLGLGFEQATETLICVLTRTGGNNRFQKGDSEEVVEGNVYLESRKNFIWTNDQTDDTTFAEFWFTPLPGYKEEAEKFLETDDSSSSSSSEVQWAS